MNFFLYALKIKPYPVDPKYQYNDVSKGIEGKTPNEMSKNLSLIVGDSIHNHQIIKITIILGSKLCKKIVERMCY